MKKISFKRPESDEPYDHIKNPRSVGLICNHVSDAVTRSLREKNLVLTLGGDHSLGLGTVSGECLSLNMSLFDINRNF